MEILVDLTSSSSSITLDDTLDPDFAWTFPSNSCDVRWILSVGTGSMRWASSVGLDFVRWMMARWRTAGAEATSEMEGALERPFSSIVGEEEACLDEVVISGWSFWRSFGGTMMSSGVGDRFLGGEGVSRLTVVASMMVLLLLAGDWEITMLVGCSAGGH